MALLLGLIMTVIPAAAAAEDNPSPETLEIANSLNCPVCQGQSVRDSNSELARQMRRVIQEKLDAGESRDEIMAFFVDRYGVSILREPPKSGFALALWWVPILALAAGLGVVALFVTQRRAGPGASAERQMADSELGRYEEQLKHELLSSDSGPR